jgi:hypothetical protein
MAYELESELSKQKPPFQVVYCHSFQEQLLILNGGIIPEFNEMIPDRQAPFLNAQSSNASSNRSRK